MKKKVFGKHLKRDANERKALFKNLLTSLVLMERIKTTEAKAKAIKGAADKLITKAKKGEAGAHLIHPLVNQEALIKLLKNIGPRFAKINGGYTRIIRIGKRRVADNAQMVYLEWSKPSIVSSEKPKTKKIKKVKGKEDAVIKEKVAIKSQSVAKPTVKQKENKAQKPGFLKQLVSRQKKG
jgi:large subunit ribosomal protein L17